MNCKQKKINYTKTIKTYKNKQIINNMTQSKTNAAFKNKNSY